MRSMLVSAAAFVALSLGGALAPPDARSQTPLETRSVPADVLEVTTAATLQAGKRYALAVAGTYREGDAGFVISYDAAYCFDSAPDNNGFCESPPKIRAGRGLLVKYDEEGAFSVFYAFAGAGAPAYATDNRYRVEFTAAKTAKLRFALGRPGFEGYDGALQVELFDATPATPPPPPPSPQPQPQPGAPGPICLPAGTTAFAAQISDDANCDLGNLPFHLDVLTAMPKQGSAADISPKALPIDTVQLGIDLADAFAEVQNEQIAATMAIAIKKDPKITDAMDGCLILAGYQELVLGKDGYVTFGGKTGFAGVAALSACKRLLIDHTPVPTRVRATAAATRCRVAFVPAFRKGRRVTARMIARSTAAVRRKISPSCTPKAGGGLSARLRPRAKGATLNKLLRTRVRAAANRRLRSGTQDKPGETLRLRWSAKQR
jgi:hypothetical protein